MKKTAKCIVSGGAGFIGSHLCELLLKRKYPVFCIDNLVTGSKKNIEHLLSDKNFNFFLHDVTEAFPQQVIKQLNTVDYIYHLASPASPVQYRKYSIETLLVNSMGTKNLLELAKKEGAFFLLASTSEVYGDPKEHPQKESYYGNVNPVGMRSCYDEGKRFAEALTMEFYRKYGLRVRIVRIFNTYGPKMMVDDGRVISNFINQALTKRPLTMYGDGLQTRSFCYIDDMVEGLVKAMETKKGCDGQVFNLGNPEEYTIKDIGKLILRLTASSSELLSTKKRPEDDPNRRKPDITKAIKKLQWYPKTRLHQGLVKTIEYFANL